jgi:NAD(P)-dependent dehydrogenase (short-subunit alcohol dehydrogenase family)
MTNERENRKKELIGRVALVTGAGRGIGRAIAQVLADAGAAVAVVARSSEEIAETAELIQTTGGQTLGLTVDLLDQHAVEQMAQEIGLQFGPVDILVNNAGRHHAIGPLWLIDPDDWWQDVEANLRSAFLCTRAIVPDMIARRRGCVINVSSKAGNGPRPYSSAYSSSKAALTRLTESLALSTKEYGVSVFAIHPGSVRTAMADYLINSEVGQTWVPELRAIYEETEIPAEQAGKLVVRLASGQADALSGRFLSVYDDIDALLERAEDIVGDDLYMLRLQE